MIRRVPLSFFGAISEPLLHDLSLALYQGEWGPSLTRGSSNSWSLYIQNRNIMDKEVFAERKLGMPQGGAGGNFLLTLAPKCLKVKNEPVRNGRPASCPRYSPLSHAIS